MPEIDDRMPVTESIIHIVHGPPYRIIYADPPYSPADAEEYGFPMVNRKKVLREAHRVLAPSGTLVWLDTMRPMYRKEQWTQWGVIGVLAGTNCRVRAISLFARLPSPSSLDGGLAASHSECTTPSSDCLCHTSPTTYSSDPPTIQDPSSTEGRS